MPVPRKRDGWRIELLSVRYRGNLVSVGQPVECQLVPPESSAQARGKGEDITQYETTQEPIQQALALNSCDLPERASARVENSKFNMRV